MARPWISPSWINDRSHPRRVPRASGAPMSLAELPPLPLDEARATPPPWAWLRPFGGFLLLWPLFALVAIDEIAEEAEWETFVVAALGPALVGLVLVAVEWLLTRAVGDRLGALGQPVPTCVRDVSNLCLTIAVLVVIAMGLLTALENRSPAWFVVAWRAAADLIALGLGVGVALRGVSRILAGPNRHQTLGESLGSAPMAVRALGYLTLVPMLLVVTVMIDYMLHGTPYVTHGELGVLLLILLIGLRSAMARAPGTWARNPWEAELRRLSLWAPWRVAGLALGLGFGGLMVALPWLSADEEMTATARVLTYALLLPLGLFCLAATVHIVRRFGPGMAGNWLAVWRLSRRSSVVRGWKLIPDRGHGRTLAIRLAGPDPHDVWLADPSDPIVAYLEAHHPQ